MKINQKQREFEPFTITFETREEAEALLYLVEEMKLVENPNARKFQVDVSNAFTDMEIVI